MRAHRPMAAGTFKAEGYAEIHRSPFGRGGIAVSAAEAACEELLERGLAAGRGARSRRCGAKGGGDRSVDGISPLVHGGLGEGLELKLLGGRSHLREKVREGQGWSEKVREGHGRQLLGGRASHL